MDRRRIAGKKNYGVQIRRPAKLSGGVKGADGEELRIEAEKAQYNSRL
jgi:hypothetical protein